MSEERSYRPSNGTEGEYFVEAHCMNCINCDPNPEGKKQCNILFASLCFDIGEEGYPKEWIYNEEGHPTCTAWVKWDWGNNGDPDDPDNPNAQIPYNPNQLVMPFYLQEIGIYEQRDPEDILDQKRGRKIVNKIPRVSGRRRAISG